jgi:hypothetical protein
MSNTINQVVLTEVKTLADLDLGIYALDTAVVRMPYSAGAIRMPYSAGAMDLRATKTVLNAVRMPYSAGAMQLRATKTVLSVG